MYVMSTVDTLKISEELIKAGLDSEVAKKLAFQFKRNEDVFLSKQEAEEKLATKKDIESISLAIEKLRSETKIEIAGLKAGMANTKSSLLMWMASMLTIQLGALVAIIKFMN